MVAMMSFLWVCVLLTADFAHAADNREDQCLVKMIVDLALQLQEQSQQLTQQETRLKEQSDLIKQQESRLQGQETQLQEQSLQLKQLQEHSGDVSSLEDDVNAIKVEQRKSAAILAQLELAQYQQDTLLKEQSAELRSLQDRVGPVESSLERSKETLVALNDSLSKQGMMVGLQSEELRSLLDKVQDVDADLSWITGNLTSLSNARVKHAAFTARYKGSDVIIDVGQGGTLKFPEVVTNVGNGYSPQTGVFTAPYSGTYAFYGTLRSSNNHGWILLGIFKGQDTVLAHYTGKGSGDPWDRGSGLGTAYLQQGDTVYVRQTGGSSHLEAGGLTSFSGMLLSAD